MDLHVVDTVLLIILLVGWLAATYEDLRYNPGKYSLRHSVTPGPLASMPMHTHHLSEPLATEHTAGFRVDIQKCSLCNEHFRIAVRQ
jgi:hypothetical protein